MVSVLLVEDEPEVAEVTCEALTEAGFHVTVAMDDKAACQTLAREARSFAAMITDINLGAGVTGFDIARLARQLNRGIKVVYISGQGPHLGQFSVSGALMVDKPFQPQELAAQVIALVGAPTGAAN
jgi:DNA-binding response OmpR family regulator